MKKHFTVDNKLLATFVCVLFLAGLYFQGTASELKEKYEAEKRDSEMHSPVPSILLGAKSAYIFNVTQNRPVYMMHESWKLPLASLTKIMTTIVAKETLSPDTTITIPKTAVSQAGDEGLLVGEKWKLDDLLKFMLTVSSNDAARAVAEAVESNISLTPDLTGVSNFIIKMNETAKRLNLQQTSFLNESGLDLSKNTASAYGSASDVATLFLYAYNTYPDLFKETTEPQITALSLSGKIHKVLNTDTITETVQHLLASKTGFTDTAGGNLALIFESNNEQMVAVVLGSSKEGRFADMRELIRAAHGWSLKQLSMASVGAL